MAKKERARKLTVGDLNEKARGKQVKGGIALPNFINYRNQAGGTNPQSRCMWD